MPDDPIPPRNRRAPAAVRATYAWIMELRAAGLTPAEISERIEAEVAADPPPEAA